MLFALRVGLSNRALILIATNVEMEILGWEPTNPRHNTSKRIFKSPGIGNKAETRSLFISSSFPLYSHLPRFAGLKRRYSGNERASSERLCR